MTKRVDDKITRGLLGRGGRMLALAAVAHARGFTRGVDEWCVLSPQLSATAYQVMEVIEAGVDPGLVAWALGRALEGEPVTAIPSWIRPALENDELASRIGETIDDELLLPALSPGQRLSKGTQRWVAALAVAFCRSFDSLKALTAKMPRADGEAALRMSRLAQATVSSGAPSKLRHELKRLVKELRSG
jgi:hypothetical protein